MKPGSVVGIATVLFVGVSAVVAREAIARCSYFASYPPAIGQHSFLLATATAATVTAGFDTSLYYTMRTAPAQVMQVANVAGYRSEEIQAGLRASGGTAVFVRYRVGIGCGPFPAFDGALDSAGTDGLYVGVPRPADRWVEGRPTFDVPQAAHFPLPQRLSAPTGHGMITRVDTAPTMSASELFTMYRALWAESVSIGDATVGARIRRWVEGNRSAARKQPAVAVATGMLTAVSDTFIAAHPVPFGGTFVIHVVVPGVDSLVTYGQTTRTTRGWISEVTRDSGTGVPVAMVYRSFAVDIATAASLEGFAQATRRNNPCAPIVTVVDALPIVPRADSTWTGQMGPSGFLDCAPQGSALAELSRPGSRSRINIGGSTPVTFRKHDNGRVTFDAQLDRDGVPVMLVRGERVSTATYNQPPD